MFEKLLENWLDNASERSYQAVFVQMLAADGYTVIHSTRHCTLEYGKDVLAVAPDGRGCVFQLKGDPRGRMTVSTFREMQPQIAQMLIQRPSIPGFPRGKFRAYLVSNGQFNEEVQIAAREMGDSAYPGALELWSRGHLIAMCSRHAARLWPSEIADTRALLEIYMSDAEGPLPSSLLYGMLNSILQLDEVRPLRVRELERAVTSAAWATGIALSAFADAKNHYAVAMGYALCAAAIRASLAKSGAKRTKALSSATALPDSLVLDSLAELWDEIACREHLTEGNPLVDADILGWRVSVLVGLMSTLALADAELHFLEDGRKQALHNWLMELKEKPTLWGEGSVPQLALWAAFLTSIHEHSKGAALFEELTVRVVTANQDKSSDALANPYHDYSDVLQAKLDADVGQGKSDREKFAGSSFAAAPLFSVLITLGCIDKAEAVWPAFSKLTHRSFDPPGTSEFWKWRSREGADLSRIFPESVTVAGLLAENEIAKVASLELLKSERTKWFPLIWLQVAPQRFGVGTAQLMLDTATSLFGSPPEQHG